MKTSIVWMACLAVLAGVWIVNGEGLSGPITGISFDPHATPDQARLLFPGGRPKAITLSYDDATLHDRRLVRILNAFGMRATFHVPFYMLPAEGFLTTNEMKELYAGHEVTVHLGGTQLPTNEYRAMVMDWRVKMEGIMGYQGRGMAYEGGEASDGAILTLPSAGIAYSRCVGSDGSFSLKTNYYTWTTTSHQGGGGDFIERFLTTTEQPAWFSMWGHSWEYEQSGTWGYWENLCGRLGGRTIIWYATCVEMADYLKAGAALRLTADGKGIENWGDIPVWLDVKGKTLCALPGKATLWTQAGKGPNPIWPATDATMRVKPPSTWIAFNDVAWASTQPISSISIYSPIQLNGGPLVDHQTGIRLPVTATFTGGKGYVEGAWPSSVQPDMPAALAFGNNLSLDGYARWEEGDVTLTFSGLSSKRQYDVVLYGSRGSTDEKYRERKTTIHLLSPGAAGEKSEGQTLSAADVGQVWSFNGLRPAADGKLVLKMTAAGGGGYLNAFMIRTSPVSAKK